MGCVRPVPLPPRLGERTDDPGGRPEDERAAPEVAERLHLSVKTVESYRARIKTKLGLTNSTELIAHAVRWVEDNRAD